MGGSIVLERRYGADIGARFEALAGLRMRVFREWPYLYDGSLEEERELLQYYLDCPQALAVIAMDGAQAVGLSTAMPATAESDRIGDALAAGGLDPGQVCYFPESILLAPYRGQGVYRRFFELREAHARRLGFAQAAFCAVERPADHPLRPAGEQPLDPVWAHFGYHRRSDLVAWYPWRDVDEPAATEKPLVFWIKPLH